jgi:hypothetical protein
MAAARGCAGGRVGGGEPPDIDFNRILARLIRYFGQTKEYWLRHGTLHDWRDLYSPELEETPPADRLVAMYFEAMKWWSPPERASAARDGAEEAAEAEVWKSGIDWGGESDAE